MTAASSVTTDSSTVIPVRYGDTAGNSIAVDTGLSVYFRIDMNPFLQFLSPPTVELPASQEEEVMPFGESEMSRLMHLDSKTNPILADIWRDDVDGEVDGS